MLKIAQKSTIIINLLTMKNNFFLFLFLIISFSFLQIISSKEVPDVKDLELIFVYQHIRHGARGPSASYNSLFKDGIDEFRVSWLGEGDGELTLVGKREHYDIGVRNRHKYGHGEHGLKLINFSTYDPEEVLFHVTDYNRTHQSLNSELIGMYSPGLLKRLNEKQVNGSFPPNEEVWKNKSKDEPLYQNILDEIKELGNSTIIGDIPIFNVHPFGPNRTFNLETNCKNLDNLRKESIENKTELLYGYFLKHSEELRKFFNFDNDSFVTDIRMMNSITDHYISDYKNYKDLTVFHNLTNINLDEFMEKSGKFYHDWMYNYYCTNITCSMESSRLMEDLLGYMERRINMGNNEKSYKAPKMVIDCGHDTTVAPMQMFMYETWKNYTDYGINTQYCGFACNIYFELYKTKDNVPKYYVFYYIDEDLKYKFDYLEFKREVRDHIYSQEQIVDYCLPEEDRKSDEIPPEKDDDEDSFIESFKKHKVLWISLFTMIFTTFLGILGIIILACKIHSIKHPRQVKPMTGKIQELSSKFITSSEVQT